MHKKVDIKKTLEVEVGEEVSFPLKEVNPSAVRKAAYRLYPMKFKISEDYGLLKVERIL